MQKLSVELSTKQVERLVDQLDVSEKLRLAEKLDRETRRARWEPLVLKMRQRFAAHPLSAREIRRICEAVRQERFERRRAAGRH